MDNMYALLYEYKMEELYILESYILEPVNEGATELVVNAIKLIFGTMFKMVKSVFDAIGSMFNMSSGGGSGCKTKLKNSKINTNAKIEVNNADVDRAIKDFVDDVEELEGAKMNELRSTLKILLSSFTPNIDRFGTLYDKLIGSEVICDLKADDYVKKVTNTLFPNGDIKYNQTATGVYTIDPESIGKYLYESKKPNSFMSANDAIKFTDKFKNLEKNFNIFKGRLARSYNELQRELNIKYKDASPEELNKIKTKVFQNSSFINGLLIILTDMITNAMAYVGTISYIHLKLLKKNGNRR